LRALWEALLTPEPAGHLAVVPIVPAALWEAALAALEPWRAARLVFDVERLAPGAAPAEALRRAAATLREAGAAALAAPLEARDLGPWRALAAYCAREPGDPAALGALFAGAGCPEAPEADILRESADGELSVVVGAGRAAD